MRALLRNWLCYQNDSMSPVAHPASVEGPLEAFLALALVLLHGLARRADLVEQDARDRGGVDRKSTRLNSSHSQISYAVFCLKKKKGIDDRVLECEPANTVLPGFCGVPLWAAHTTASPVVAGGDADGDLEILRQTAARLLSHL